MQRVKAVLVEASCDPRWSEICRSSQRLDLDGAYPRVPSSGLAALVAPDGVMVRVVDCKFPQSDLEDLVRLDILRRQLREEHAVLIQQGKSLIDCMAILMPRFAALKAGYKLEALG